MGGELVTSPRLGTRARAPAEVKANTLTAVDEEDDEDIQSAMAIRLELIQEDQRRHRKRKCCMIIMVCCFVLLGWSGGVLGAWILRAIEGYGNQVPTLTQTVVIHIPDLLTPIMPTIPTTPSVLNNSANETVDVLPTEKNIPTTPIVPNNLTTPIVSNYSVNATTNILLRGKRDLDGPTKHGYS